MMHLVGRAAAGNVEHRTGGKRAILRRQPRHHCGEFFHQNKTPFRNLRQHEVSPPWRNVTSGSGRLRFANTEFGAPGCGGRSVQTRDGGAKFPEKQQWDAAPVRQQALGRLRRPKCLQDDQCGGVYSASSVVVMVGSY
jgi:hypothetical protein